MKKRNNDKKGMERAFERLNYSKNIEDESGNKKSKESFNRNYGWSEEKIENKMPKNKKKFKTSKALMALIIGAVAFFIFSVGMAAYVFLSGDVFIGPGNVSIEIDGDDKIDAGDKVSLIIEIKNRNPVPLENVEVFLRYPEGSFDPEDGKKPIIRHRENIGDVSSKGIQEVKTSFILSGEKDSEKVFSVEIEYSIEGSNTRFSSSGEFRIKIDSSPLSLVLDSLNNITVGKETSFFLKIVSKENLKNVFIRADYPRGFSITNSDPDFYQNKSTWFFESLLEGEGKELKVNGIFSENLDEEDEETISFLSGLGGSDFTPLAAVSKEILVKEPTVLVVMNPFDPHSDNLISQGEEVFADIIISNNNSEITNGELTLYFSKSGFNSDSVSADGADVNSSSQTISWNYEDYELLKNIESGEEIAIPLSFQFKEDEGDKALVNVEFNAKSEDNSRLSSSMEYEFILSGDISLNTEGLFSTGNFTNYGSIPPRVGQATSYTASFFITARGGSLSNARLSATIPSYAELINHSTDQGNVSVNDENILLWNIGRVNEGVGFITSPLESSFQIEVIPESEHLDEILTILYDIVLEGVDEASEMGVSIEAIDITSRINNDPTYSSGDEYVEE